MTVFPDDLDDTDVSALDVDDEYGRGKGHHKPYCDAVWFGFNIQHCPVCHQTFSGSTTGDAHDVGPPIRRRCRTPAELEALGLWVETNDYGTDVWHGSPNKAGMQKRHPLREQPGAS